MIKKRRVYTAVMCAARREMVKDTPNHKIVTAKGYNMVFNKHNGTMLRWGVTCDDDPQLAPLGPEILDLEISTGDCSGRCPWCSPAGTVVSSVHGPVAIETIQLGDLVIGHNGSRPSINEVLETYSRQYSGTIVDVEMEDGNVISLTPEHEVFLTDGRKISAGKLRPGMDVIAF